MTADYAAGFGGNDNNAAGHVDPGRPSRGRRVTQKSVHADTDNAGMSGHSLGGKLALLAATLDPRVKASIVLDPVDGNGVTVADLFARPPHPHRVPRRDARQHRAKGLGQACAPKNANCSTFYAQASSPSIEVTLDGARPYELPRQRRVVRPAVHALPRTRRLHRRHRAHHARIPRRVLRAAPRGTVPPSTRI